VAAVAAAVVVAENITGFTENSYDYYFLPNSSKVVSVCLYCFVVVILV